MFGEGSINRNTIERDTMKSARVKNKLAYWEEHRRRKREKKTSVVLRIATVIVLMSAINIGYWVSWYLPEYVNKCVPYKIQTPISYMYEIVSARQGHTTNNILLTFFSLSLSASLLLINSLRSLSIILSTLQWFDFISGNHFLLLLLLLPGTSSDGIFNDDNPSKNIKLNGLCFQSIKW